jgi:hypothetical protein
MSSSDEINRYHTPIHPLNPDRLDQWAAEHAPLVIQPTAYRLDYFRRWIAERKTKGIFFHPSLAWISSAKMFGHGVGAFTTINLKAGTTILKVPKTLILSVRTVSNQTVRSILSGENFRNVIGLAIAYLHETCKGEESPFFGYLSCFTLPDVPRLWPDEDKLLLRGTQIQCDKKLDLVTSY